MTDISFKIDVDSTGVIAAANAVGTLKDRIDGIKESTEPAANSVAALRDQISSLRTQRDSIDINSKAFEELQGKIKLAQSQMKEINQEAKGLGAEQIVRSVTRIGEGIAGSFVLAKQAVANFTGSSAAAEAAQKTAEQAIIAVLAVRRVVEGYLSAVQLARLVITKLSTAATDQETTSTESNVASKESLTVANEQAAVSQEELNTAVSVNPYVAAGVALAVIVGIIAAYAIGSAEAATEQEKLNRQIDTLKDGAANFKKISDANIEFARSLGASKTALDLLTQAEIANQLATDQGTLALQRRNLEIEKRKNDRGLVGNVGKSLLGDLGAELGLFDPEESEGVIKLKKEIDDLVASVEAGQKKLSASGVNLENDLLDATREAELSRIAAEKDGIQKRLDGIAVESQKVTEDYDNQKQIDSQRLASLKQYTTAYEQLKQTMQKADEKYNSELRAFSNERKIAEAEAAANTARNLFAQAQLVHDSAEHQIRDLSNLQAAELKAYDAKNDPKDPANATGRYKLETEQALAAQNLKQQLDDELRKNDFNAAVQAAEGSGEAVYEITLSYLTKTRDAALDVLDDQHKKLLLGDQKYAEEVFKVNSEFIAKTNENNKKYYEKQLGDQASETAAAVALTVSGTEERRRAVESGIRKQAEIEKQAEEDRYNNALLDNQNSVRFAIQLATVERDNTIERYRFSASAQARIAAANAEFENKKLEIEQHGIDAADQINKTHNEKTVTDNAVTNNSLLQAQLQFVQDSKRIQSQELDTKIIKDRGDPVAEYQDQVDRINLIREQAVERAVAEYDRDLSKAKITDDEKFLAHKKFLAAVAAADATADKAKEDLSAKTIQRVLSDANIIASGLQTINQQQMSNDQAVADNKIALIEKEKQAQLDAIDAEYNRLSTHNRRINVLDLERAKAKAKVEADAKKKEDAIKLDQFNKQKAADAEQAEINGLLAATAALTQVPFGPWNVFEAVAITALAEINAQTIRAKPVPAFAQGAINIQGPGTGTSDSIMARISAGESVINAQSTRRFAPLLSAINQDGGGRAFAQGGVVTDGNAAPMRLHPDDIRMIVDGWNNKKVYQVTSDVTNAIQVEQKIINEAKW